MKLYATIEPQGEFPAAKAKDIEMPDGTRLDAFNPAYPVVAGTSGQTLAPERHYVFGSVTELTVKLEQINDGKAHEYWFEFEPAEGFTGLTISPMVRWMAEPQYPAGKKCLVGIVRGMAVMGCG